MDIFRNMFMIFFISGSAVVQSIYFPAQKIQLWYRLGSVPHTVANVTAFLYTGRPAPAHYSTSLDYIFEVDSHGSVSWKTNVTAPMNVTAKINATYKRNKAETELHVSVLQAIKNPCETPVQELCFSGAEVNDFQVYEDTHHSIPLIDFRPHKIPCKLPKSKYTIKGGEGGVARLRDGLLEVTPSLAKGDFQVNISCSRDKGTLVRQIRVQLMPGRVKLPIIPEGVSRRVVPSINKGSELLLCWAVVKKGTPTALDKHNDSLPYTLRLSKYDFTTDIVNTTLLLVRLTWTKNVTSNYLKVPVKIKTCADTENSSKSCKKEKKDCQRDTTGCELEIYTEIQVALRDKVIYPSGILKITPSPYARVAQPQKNRSNDSSLLPFVFRSAVPDLLENPFEITESQGIVYFTNWSLTSTTISHETSSPGILVEWFEDNKDDQSEKGVGLAWLDITLAKIDCTFASTEICAEANSEKSCQKPCRIGAGPYQKGRCQWRSNSDNTSGLTRNYATCSPDLTYCPDKTCDPLERLNHRLCPQDCTDSYVPLGILDEDMEGIKSGRGICTCDDTGKCHCGIEVVESRPAEWRGSKKQQLDEHRQQEQPLTPPKLTAAVAPHQAEERTCGSQCVAVIVLLGAGVVFILATVIYLATSRTCLMKAKGQNATEYSAHALLPLNTTDLRTTPVTDTLLHTHEIDPKWEVPRSKLAVEECLGEGEFGKVLRATARDLPNNPGFLTVAVKTLKANAGQSELEDLMSEYELLKEVSHPNVIKLLGACTTPGHPVYIIIEFCALGSLRAYLRRHRNIKTDNEVIHFQTKDEISPRDILSFAWQISKGMAYLTEIKLVHRDLAARNILLATGKVCKISDFGLTRDVYVDDTYLKKSRGRVPVKWMALESLSDHIYTSKSDVWSFGVVLWELVTLGSSPYPGVAVQNLYHLLKNGYRMQKPNNCSDLLYSVMRECWSANPTERPSFASLVNKFEKMLEDGADYLDCNINMVSNPSYFTDFNGQGPKGSDEMDITFTMKIEDDDEPETDSTRYENDSVNKNTSYDIPKPISSIIMSDLISKDEQR